MSNIIGLEIKNPELLNFLELSVEQGKSLHRALNRIARKHGRQTCTALCITLGGELRVVENKRPGIVLKGTCNYVSASYCKWNRSKIEYQPSTFELEVPADKLIEMVAENCEGKLTKKKLAV